MEEDFTEKEALQNLEDKINGMEWFSNASIGRIPEMDAGGLFTFSIMPERIGKAGEVIYMVGQDRILTSGNDDDFKWLINRLGAGKKENTISLAHFVELFLRMRAGRRGVLLYEIDGHVLLKHGQIPAGKFVKPSVTVKENTVNYSFWIFDTDRYIPVFYTVVVYADGYVEYDAIE